MAAQEAHPKGTTQADISARHRKWAMVTALLQLTIAIRIPRSIEEGVALHTTGIEVHPPVDKTAMAGQAGYNKNAYIVASQERKHTGDQNARANTTSSSIKGMYTQWDKRTGNTTEQSASKHKHVQVLIEQRTEVEGAQTSTDIRMEGQQAMERPVTHIHRGPLNDAARQLFTGANDIAKYNSVIDIEQDATRVGSQREPRSSARKAQAVSVRPEGSGAKSSHTTSGTTQGNHKEDHTVADTSHMYKNSTGREHTKHKQAPTQAPTDHATSGGTHSPNTERWGWPSHNIDAQMKQPNRSRVNAVLRCGHSKEMERDRHTALSRTVHRLHEKVRVLTSRGKADTSDSLDTMSSGNRSKDKDTKTKLDNKTQKCRQQATKGVSTNRPRTRVGQTVPKTTE